MIPALRRQDARPGVRNPVRRRTFWVVHRDLSRPRSAGMRLADRTSSTDSLSPAPAAIPAAIVGANRGDAQEVSFARSWCLDSLMTNPTRLEDHR
jgi:hypothetical protein